MDRVADGFIWPVRDPEWVTKILVIGLILLIPIAGAINGIGWMLATLDRLRAGEERMAPANLSHLRRGVGLFVVQLGYGIAIALIAGAFYLPGLIVATAEGNDKNASPAAIGRARMSSTAPSAPSAKRSTSASFSSVQRQANARLPSE